MNPDFMLTVLGSKADKRKLRLFGCACCHEIIKYMTQPESKTAIERAEEYADKQIKRAVLIAAHEGATRHVRDEESTPCEFAAASVSRPAINTRWVADLCRRGFWRNNYYDFGTWNRADAKAGAVQASLLRDIFANPYRPLTFDPSWRTSTAVTLAEGIYADRAFDRLPILADALENAGCGATELLAHLRDDGPHVRGCWALDLVLGKA